MTLSWTIETSLSLFVVCTLLILLPFCCYVIKTNSFPLLYERYRKDYKNGNTKWFRTCVTQRDSSHKKENYVLICFTSVSPNSNDLPCSLWLEVVFWNEAKSKFYFNFTKLIAHQNQMFSGHFNFDFDVEYSGTLSTISKLVSLFTIVFALTPSFCSFRLIRKGGTHKCKRRDLSHNPIIVRWLWMTLPHSFSITLQPNPLHVLGVR